MRLSFFGMLIAIRLALLLHRRSGRLPLSVPMPLLSSRIHGARGQQSGPVCVQGREFVAPEDLCIVRESPHRLKLQQLRRQPNLVGLRLLGCSVAVVVWERIQELMLQLCGSVPGDFVVRPKRLHARCF